MITNKETNFISVVVYVYNDEKTIKYFLNHLYQLLDNNFSKYEIICVNDASTDNSVPIINEVSKNFNNASVTILNMSFHQGIEIAMTAGIELSIGDYVYEFDTNFIDYDIDKIVEVYNKLLEGYDIVALSPNKNNSIASTLFYKLINQLYSQSQIQTERFRLLSRRAINRICQNTENIIYRKAIYYNCGLKINSIKYKPIRKFVNTQCFTYRQNLAVDSIIAFTNIGYKLSLFATLFMMLFSIFSIAYSGIIKIIGLSTAGGWTTLVWMISLSFFVLFALLSIAIRYLSLIFRMLNGKTKYSFESIIKVNKN